MTDEEIIALRDSLRPPPGLNNLTLAFARSLIAATREQVIEECAKVCEELPDYYGNDPGSSFSIAIRALATRPPGQ